MPELKRLDGIVIYLMFNDIKHQIYHMFMFFMGNLELRLQSMELY